MSTVEDPNKRSTADDVLKFELQPGQGVMAIINETGDKKTIWNRSDVVEVEAARREFDFMRSKGYMAYKVEGSEGRRGEVINKFDPDAERIIFAPPMRGGSGRVTALVLAACGLSADVPPKIERLPLAGGPPVLLEVGPGKNVTVTFHRVKKDDIVELLSTFFSNGSKDANTKVQDALSQSEQLTFVLTTKER